MVIQIGSARGYGLHRRAAIARKRVDLLILHGAIMGLPGTRECGEHWCAAMSGIQIDQPIETEAFKKAAGNAPSLSAVCDLDQVIKKRCKGLHANAYLRACLEGIRGTGCTGPIVFHRFRALSMRDQTGAGHRFEADMAQADFRNRVPHHTGSILAMLVFGWLVLGSPAYAQVSEADRATILILDASGSMWGELDGRTKIEVARDVISDYLRSRDASTPLGVVAYGHRRRGDCGDIEVLYSPAIADPVAVSEEVNTLNPRGKTPIADALRLAAQSIPATAEEADIVLVTDGIETCVPDVCAVTDELLAQGIVIRAHVVGFGLTEEEADTLACIPQATGGRLLRPATGDELAAALSRTSERRAEAAPVGQGAITLSLLVRGGMPESFEWALREDATGQETVLGTMTGDARYDPFPLDLVPGRYTALVTTRAGQGEARFEVAAGDNFGVSVPLFGDQPDLSLRNRGPYTAGENVLIDLSIDREGLELGGASFTLNLYRALPSGEPDGPAITWTYVDGNAGVKANQLSMPAEPGAYVAQFETASGEVLDSLRMVAELDPPVELIAPPVVEPGAVVDVQSFGRQAGNDRLDIWKDGQHYAWGARLVDIPQGNPILAPTEPGDYTLVYLTTRNGGEQEVVAQLPLSIGTVVDDATGPAALEAVPSTVEAAPASPPESIKGQAPSSTETQSGLLIDARWALAAPYDGQPAWWSVVPTSPTEQVDAFAPPDMVVEAEGSFEPGFYRVTAIIADGTVFEDISGIGPAPFDGVRPLFPGLVMSFAPPWEDRSGSVLWTATPVGDGAADRQVWRAPRASGDPMIAQLLPGQWRVEGDADGVRFAQTILVDLDVPRDLIIPRSSDVGEGSGDGHGPDGDSDRTAPLTQAGVEDMLQRLVPRLQEAQ